MNTPNESRSKITGLLIIALTFSAGIAVGMAGERLLLRGAMSRTMVVRDMSDVLDRLQLDSTQRARAEIILDRSAPRSRQVMLEVAVRLRNISDSVDAELRSILTHEQQNKLDSLRHPLTFVLREKQPGGITTVDTVRPQH
jgi:hypothetical protein